MGKLYFPGEIASLYKVPLVEIYHWTAKLKRVAGLGGRSQGIIKVKNNPEGRSAFPESLVKIFPAVPDKETILHAIEEEGKSVSGKKIYFAGPFFFQAEKEFNLQFVREIEFLGFEVFLPQRDGVGKNRVPFSKMSRQKIIKAIFNLNVEKITDSDIFLFISDGRIPNESACVELGIAYQLKRNEKRKLILGLQTDTRTAFLNAKLNAMLLGCFDFLFENKNDLLSFLRAKTCQA